MNKKISVIICISLIILLSTAVQVVSAKSVEREDTVNITTDPRADYDTRLNLVNNSNNNYSNYEMFWKDFKNEKDMSGVVSSVASPPSKVEIDNITNDDWIHVGVTTTFTSQQVMEGSSNQWWRTPFSLPMDENYDMRLRLYRVNNPETANMTIDSGSMEVSERSNPSKIFDSGELFVHEDNETRFMRHNKTLPEDFIEGNETYNFTYIKSIAPIYAGEDYYAVFSYSGDVMPNYYVSSFDVGGNEVHKTHVSHGDPIEKETFKADFDIGVLHQTGISDYVGGVDMNGDFREIDTTTDTLIWKRKFDGTEFDSGEYISVHFPFLYNIDETVNISLTINFMDSDGTEIADYEWVGEYRDWFLENLSYSDVSWSMDTDNIDYLLFNLETDGINEDQLLFWIYDYNNNYTKDYEYSSSKFRSKVSGSWTVQEMGFQIWHSVHISNRTWELINPIEYYSFEKLEIKRDEGINWDTVISVLEHGALLLSGGAGIALSTYMMNNYGDTPPHEILMEWRSEANKAVLDWALNVGDALIQIGNWIWDKITWFVDAVVYYGTALINLIVLGFSLASYMIFVAVTVKVSLGLLILVQKGVDPMLEYYSCFMDEVIGMTQKAASMLPGV